MDLRITTARLTRTLVCAGLVLGLLHLAHADDFFSSVTRPAALALLHAVGQTASDRGDCLVVGALLVPWSRDCAGLNLLAVLWAMILWTNVGESSTTRAWLRLALAVPAAIVANVARVLTIIGYRLALVPAVESPQLHYFIGFLWLMPCVGLFIPRGGRSLGCYLLETLHLAAALSLLAPLVPGPGGSFAALSALVLLSQNKFLQRQSSALIAVGALWLLAGAFIAWASMESLWLPWLLACPWFTSTGVLVP